MNKIVALMLMSLMLLTMTVMPSFAEDVLVDDQLPVTNEDAEYTFIDFESAYEYVTHYTNGGVLCVLITKEGVEVAPDLVWYDEEYKVCALAYIANGEAEMMRSLAGNIIITGSGQLLIRQSVLNEIIEWYNNPSIE